MSEKNCKDCIHFCACCKWTDFPKQCGVPVCAKFEEKNEGEWVKVAAYNDGVLNTVKCSVCRTYQPIGDWDYTTYCPFCGAKMKGVNTEC